VLAFSVAQGPRSGASAAITAEESAIRAVATRISRAVDEAREAEEATRREPEAGPGEEREDAEGAVMGVEVGSPGAAPAPSPSRAFEVPPPPPQRPRRRFNE
jgi:hypothetical protein